MWWTCVYRYALYKSECCYYLLMMVIRFWIMLFDCTLSVCNLTLGLRSKLEFTMFLSRLVCLYFIQVKILKYLIYVNCFGTKWCWTVIVFFRRVTMLQLNWSKLPYFKNNVWEFFINQRSSIIPVCIFLTNRVRYHNNFNLKLKTIHKCSLPL